MVTVYLIMLGLKETEILCVDQTWQNNYCVFSGCMCMAKRILLIQPSSISPVWKQARTTNCYTQ